jgi:predicted branched-subunit amino acid permease
MTDSSIQNSFSQGLRDGIPIGLGYLSVSFAFGLSAVAAGLPVWGAVLISMTNVTSAGQVAGLSLIAASAALAEQALTQLVINLRYALMSLSLSQKLAPGIGLLDRLFMSFLVTDEVFAVASSQPGLVGRRYFSGLMLAPYLGWSLGTFLGAAAGTILPGSVQSALGIAIYGMFLAIIIPPAKYLAPVRRVLALAVGLRCLIAWTPLSRIISSGFAIILCTLAAAGVGAWLFPREEADHAG